MAKRLGENARKEKPEQTAVHFFNIAWFAAMQGNGEKALVSLRQAIENGYGHYAELRIRPDWDILQEKKEFVDLLASVEEEKRREDHG